jgi:hypothetical protein
MKPIRTLLLVALALFACAPLASRLAAADTLRLDLPTGLYGASQAPAAFYSFSDVYRLTVSGPEGVLESSADAALADLPMRVVSVEAPAAAYVFSISGVKEPERWLLVLTGLALAAWVARRRLVQAI